VREKKEKKEKKKKKKRDCQKMMFDQVERAEKIKWTMKMMIKMIGRDGFVPKIVYISSFGRIILVIHG
jgi:hypothetical protein